MRVFKILPCLILIILLATSLSAQAAASDPPGCVGRLSYAEGAVSFHAADQADWSQATLNYPLTTGDSLWTDVGARAEIQIGSAEIYLDQVTEVDVTQLDDSAIRLAVLRGSINVHFTAVPLNGDIKITAPAGDVTLNTPGTYRIDAGQQTTVTTLQGQALVTRPVVTQVMTDQSVILVSDRHFFGLGINSAFDRWAQQRNAPPLQNFARYVSPQMTGYEDLSNYGDWATEADYGTVWYPQNIATD